MWNEIHQCGDDDQKIFEKYFERGLVLLMDLAMMEENPEFEKKFLIMTSILP